jgi:hypothetical protein
MSIYVGTSIHGQPAEAISVGSFYAAPDFGAIMQLFHQQQVACREADEMRLHGAGDRSVEQIIACQRAAEAVEASATRTSHIMTERTEATRFVTSMPQRPVIQDARAIEQAAKPKESPAAPVKTAVVVAPAPAVTQRVMAELRLDWMRDAPVQPIAVAEAVTMRLPSPMGAMMDTDELRRRAQMMALTA